MSGQADGSIIVDATLDTKGFDAGSARMQSAMKSLSGSAQRLRKEMQILRTQKFATGDYKQVQQDIAQAEKYLDQYNQKLAQLSAKGKVDTPEWKALTADIRAASDELSRLRAVEAELNRSNAFGSLLQKAKQFMWTLSKTSVAKLASGLKSAASHMARLVTQSKLMKRPLENMSFMLRRIAPSLLMTEGIFGLLRKAVMAFLQENEHLATKLNACWTGIGNILGPIITRLINLVATAVSYVTMFLNLLGLVGKGTTKAINSAGKAAEKQTDKLKGQLASFDELNVLQNEDDDDSSESTPGSSGITPPDWLILIAENLKSGRCEAAALILTTLLNQMVAGVDWDGIGDKLAYWIDNILRFIGTAIRTFDWRTLGTSLSKTVNRIISGVDWSNLGTVLGAKFIILLGSLGGFLANLDWAGLGSALSGAFTGIWNSIDWAAAGQLITNGVVGLLTVLTTFISTVDWQTLGNAIAMCVSNIDWSVMVSALFVAIDAALGGLAGFLFGLFEIAFNSLTSMGQEYADEYGVSVAEGVLFGIMEALYNLGSWVVENVFNPFIDAFKSAFGINSPSTVMREQGGFIIAGLLEGLKTTKDKWSSIGSNICAGIGNGISSGWSWLKKKVQNLASNLLSAAKSALGIHSPSKLFRDTVGLNIGYGVGEGIEAAEGSVLGSVAGVADAISKEFNANEYSVGGVVSNTEVDGALTAFSDKIAGSFTALMDRMQAIANSVSFTVPGVAQGSVVPYTAQATRAGSTSSGSSTGSEKTASDISEAIYAAVLAAMRQSESNGTPAFNIYLDGRQITAAVEKRQRERGTSIVGKQLYAY